MLTFIDQIVIPFLNVAVRRRRLPRASCLAMAIESAMIPLPSELILPFAGFLVSDPTQIEPITGAAVELLDRRSSSRRSATRSARSSRYAIGAWGGRPFLERYGKYLLIRDHEIEVGGARSSTKYGAATAFFSRLLPIVRTFISFPAGVARMPLGKFILFSTARRVACGRSRSSTRARSLGANWVDIRHALQPFDMLIAVVVVVAGRCSFLWWRLGMPGRPKAASTPAVEAAADPAETEA